MQAGKVSCLMATHGRYQFVCQTLAGFLKQDYPNRELIILNNHPTPMVFDHPLVKILNEPNYATLGNCRTRLLEAATGEFCRSWDDDDIYMPWAVSQGVENIGDAAAWKPKCAWWTNDGGKNFSFSESAMEASITWRTAEVRRIGYANLNGSEHKLLLEQIRIQHTEVGAWTPYAYCWGNGAWHVSGTPEYEGKENDWKSHCQDTGDGKPLIPSDLTNWYRMISRFVPPLLQDVWWKAVLGLSKPYADPIPFVAAVGLEKAKQLRELPFPMFAAPGCWDVLTEGKVEMLKWASDRCHTLAVLVNDDTGVAAQKGVNRPLVPFAGRIAALAALDCVDVVIPIIGVDDLPTLEILNPSAVIKGPDYFGKEGSVPRPSGCSLFITPESRCKLRTSDLVA